MIMNRRKLIVGLGALIAAPAIVRASSLMKVRAFEEFSYLTDQTAWFINSPLPSPKLIALMEHVRATQELMAANIFNGLMVPEYPDSVRFRAKLPPDFLVYVSAAS